MDKVKLILNYSKQIYLLVSYISSCSDILSSKIGNASNGLFMLLPLRNATFPGCLYKGDIIF